MRRASFRTALAGLAATTALLFAGHVFAQQAAPAAEPPTAAADFADFFSDVGDQIYRHCIFELSEEQLEVQQALIQAYIKQGAGSSLARQLAVKQIQLPKLSDDCERVRNLAGAQPWAAVATPTLATPPKIDAVPPKSSTKILPVPSVLAHMKVLPQWDCAPGVDFVAISHRGYERKLTGGEICSPYEDVVRAVPDSLKSFRLGYTITTGRLFVIADDPQVTGKTIAWAVSGREGCRNNPHPDCLAARAIGPLPPGEYAFTSEETKRVTWGPKSKRMVAGIHLTKLWHKEKYSPAQTKAILARGNIAIHVRLKGEMSEACIALEPKGWNYVSGLISQDRVTGVNVYVDEPHAQLAEAPPVVRASSFSLSSLFK
jgi:hypothetical protein